MLKSPAVGEEVKQDECEENTPPEFAGFFPWEGSASFIIVNLIFLFLPGWREVEHKCKANGRARYSGELCCGRLDSSSYHMPASQPILPVSST